MFEWVAAPSDSGFVVQALSIVLDAAVKSVVILAAAGLAVLVMRRASAATRHCVWFVAMTSLLLLPALDVTLPGWRILPEGWDLTPNVEPQPQAGPIADSMTRPAPPALDPVASSWPGSP